MIKSILTSIAVFILPPSAHAGFSEKFQSLSDATQAGYMETEVGEAKVLLLAGTPSPLCGYQSPGVWASTSLRRMLVELKKRVEADFDVSQPRADGDATICVTVTPIRAK